MGSRIGRPVAVGVVAALVALAGTAAAHDLAASRFDAPLPFSLLLVGGGATVVATAVLVERAPGLPRPRRRVRLPLCARTAAAVRGVGSVVALAAFVAILLAGSLGPLAPAENGATVATWSLWFRGLALLAVLVGSAWPTLSPWRTLYRGLRVLEGRPVALRPGVPDAVGHWPATLAFVALFGAVATLTTAPLAPRTTAAVLSAYAFVQLAGAVVFGPEWFERADAFGVFYDLLGRVAPLVVADGGGLTVRAPWDGCLSAVADRSLVAFVVAAVYVVSFDGLTNTPEFRDVLAGLRRAAGLGPEAAVAAFGLGLVGFLASFVAVSRLADRLGGRDADDVAASAAFAPTVLPIAAAYEVAHNYPYVIRSAGRLATLVLRDAGVDAALLEPLAWLPLEAFWASQVGLVVAGHVAAAVAAHGVATRRYRSRAAARRGHLPLLAVMVGYTLLSLWIVSRPVVAFA
jgi:hypothetical protein